MYEADFQVTYYPNYSQNKQGNNSSLIKPITNLQSKKKFNVLLQLSNEIKLT